MELLESCLKTCMTYTIAECTVNKLLMMDRRKNLLYDLKDRRGYSHLKEALDRTMWRNRFRGGFGPVVRQNIESMNDGQTIGPKHVEFHDKINL